MSAAADREILVVAFQDAPALLAVRLQLPIDPALAARFAITRRPDSGGGGNHGSVGCLIIAGVIGTVLAVNIVPGCLETARPDPPALIESRSTDAAGDSFWSARLAQLAMAYEPTRADLKPWAVRSLLDVPRELARSGDAAGGWLRPACTGEDTTAHARAATLAGLLRRSGEAAGTAIILDLPGPQSFAAAAALAGEFEPVVSIDNLPHPQGVVPSAQTLAAAVHWRPLVEQARKSRRAGAPPCFVLEGRRLEAYANEVERFDNRSLARLPDAAALKALGVTRVLYVRPSEGALQETDDLNALLSGLPAAGIGVRHLGLDTVASAPEEGPERPAGGTSAFHTWLWLRGPGVAYRASPRPFAALGGLDGGATRREEVLGLLRPAPRPSSSGGSWHRSSHRSGG